MAKVYDVIIIGSGPAGYTAALYSSRAELSTLILAGSAPGGQLMLTTEVENYPGFSAAVMGPDLMATMRAQATNFGAELVEALATRVDLQAEPKLIQAGDTKYLAHSVIITTGAEAKWLGLESEQRLRGHGVSACATCDGYFFRDKTVVVVGGGDSAMEEALFLTKFATKVTVIHRRDELRASKIMQARARANQKIEFCLDSEVVEVLGDKLVSGVRLKNNQTKAETTFDCQGVFVAIGHQPATEIFAGQLNLDSVGYIRTRDVVKTDLPGVFAAGDVADPHYRQAVTAAGDGCRAALEAERYLESIRQQ